MPNTSSGKYPSKPCALMSKGLCPSAFGLTPGFSAVGHPRLAEKRPDKPAPHRSVALKALRSHPCVALSSFRQKEGASGISEVHG